MKKSRFSEEQIARAAPGRKPHGSRGCVSPVGRERGHVLRLEKEFAHLSVSERRRMRSLEEENTRVKHVVAAFEGAVARGALPRSITVDHGTEFKSKAVDAWRHAHNTHCPHSSPGGQTLNECAAHHQEQRAADAA